MRQVLTDFHMLKLQIVNVSKNMNELFEKLLNTDEYKFIFYFQRY